MCLYGKKGYIDLLDIPIIELCGTFVLYFGNIPHYSVQCVVRQVA